MSSNLHDKLDELSKSVSIIRKRAIEPTDECTIWNPYDEVWEESDDQFRQRIAKQNGVD